MLPGLFARLHPAHGTPKFAILFNTLGAALLIPFSFQELLELDMFLYAAALILEFCALFQLRLKKPDMPRPYRIPFGMAGVAALSLPPICLCFLSIGISNKLSKGVGIMIVIIGVLIYHWANKGASRSTI
jgi:amino acid transporter